LLNSKIEQGNLNAEIIYTGQRNYRFRFETFTEPSSIERLEAFSFNQKLPITVTD